MPQELEQKIKAKYVHTTHLGDCQVAIVYQAGSESADLLLQPYYAASGDDHDYKGKGALKEFTTALTRLSAANYDVQVHPGLMENPPYVTVDLKKGAPLTKETLEGLVSVMAGRYKPMPDPVAQEIYADKFTDTKSALVEAANDVRAQNRQSRMDTHMINCGEDKVRAGLNTAIAEAHLTSLKRQ